MPSDYRPRLSIDLTEEQHNALNHYIPWGMKSALFHALIDGLIDALHHHGLGVLTLIMERKIGWREVLPNEAGRPEKVDNPDGRCRTT
jgi:hypothetical protein